MVIVHVRDNEELYIDENLKNNLDAIKKSVLEENWDYVCVFAGNPRVGKSTFAQQIATYLDPSFNVDRVCFSAKEYLDKTDNGSKGQAFILDESFADLNASLSRNPEFISIIDHLSTIGKKNEFHLLILPDFFSLARGVAITRADHLFMVYAVDRKRGRFAAFDREAKRELYLKGKPFANYYAAEPNFRGRFVGKWFIDEKEYELRKDKHLKEKAHKEKSVEGNKRWLNQRNILIKELVNNQSIPARAVADRIGVDSDTIYAVLQGKQDHT